MSQWYLENFAPILMEIEDSMQTFAHRRPQVAPLFWEIVDYHFQWSGETKRAGGKKLRPLLALLVARAIRGDYHHAMPAAVALEMVHNFTLIHDDIMDNSPERRHRQTVWSKWNISQAINAGDGIYTLAMMSLLDLLPDCSPQALADAYQTLLSACLATVEGQVLDIGFETRSDVTPDEYIQMIAHKSAALISCSAKLGARLSTEQASVIQGYADFGWNIGIAFQIWDDYLGIWGQESETGKSATSDIEGKKKSYPALLAFQDAQTHDAIDKLYRKEVLSQSDIAQVLEILQSINAQDRTQALMQDYYHKALASLDSTNISGPNQQILRDLAAFFIERAF